MLGKKEPIIGGVGLTGIGQRGQGLVDMAGGILAIHTRHWGFWHSLQEVGDTNRKENISLLSRCQCNNNENVSNERTAVAPERVFSSV